MGCFTRKIAVVPVLAAMGLLFPAHVGHSDSLLLVDVHEMPLDCPTPSACVDAASPLMTNILSLSSDESSVLQRILNAGAIVRGVPRNVTSGLCKADRTEELQAIPKAERLSPLINHPGVYFDSTKIDEDETTANFSKGVRAVLERIGLKLLTKEEMEMTPGRPTLTVNFSPRRESEGCIIPYSVSMAIKEEVVMVRDTTIKLSGNAWAGSVRENLANRNFTPTSALNEVLQKLEKDFTAANSS